MTDLLISIESIEEWRKMAFALTKSDPPMGNVLAKSLDLMSTVAREGIADPYLTFSVETVTCERELAMKRDANKDELLRKVVYGMSESLETMIKVLIAKSGEERVETATEENAFEQHLGTPSEASHAVGTTFISANDPEANAVFDFTDIKREPLDPLMQAMADAIDGKERDMQQVQPAQQENNSQQRGRSELTDTSNEGSDNEDEEPSRKRVRLQTRYEEDGDYGRRNRKSSGNARSVNTTNKSHVCDVCGLAFRCAAYLGNHMGTHTGIRPYACSFCDETFLRSSKHKQHLREKHDVLSYECTSCNEKFAKLQQLREHWKREAHKPTTSSDKKKRFETD